MHLFINPYRRLSTIVELYEKRLRAIDIPHVESTPIPATREQVDFFQKQMRVALESYQEAMSLCVSLQMIAPVLGEAAINFLMMIMAKPEVRSDKRLREDFSRRHIDVRIKTLHLVCDGFEGKITGSEDEFKDFMRLINRRNDSLHGNIDPHKTTGEELFFDFHTIPLFSKNQSIEEIFLTSALANLSSEEALADVVVVRRFVAFLLSRIEPQSRAVVMQAMDELQLGFRRDTATIGVILPPATAVFFRTD